jgi:hypothetical protein
MPKPSVLGVRSMLLTARRGNFKSSGGIRSGGILLMTCVPLMWKIPLSPITLGLTVLTLMK